MEYIIKNINLSNDELYELTGTNNKNLEYLENLYGANLLIRNNEIKIYTENENGIDNVIKHINFLLNEITQNNHFDENTFKQTYFEMLNDNNEKWQNEIVGYTFDGKPLKFQTYNQFVFKNSVNKHDLVISSGPAGTGKTYLSCLMASLGYKKGIYKKIIITRPAVESGESLGFLPGDLKEKVDPYLMPIYDSLNEILGNEQVEKLIEKNVIEVIPLAYMRGRTLNDSFIILDEAQNTTSTQMLMFLTRLGKNSKMIVNGDVTQIDLNQNKAKSGLIEALSKLKDIKEIGFVEFKNSDVVRNPLVEKIIEKYQL